MSVSKKAAFKSWLIWYLRQPFVMVVWFMETFAKNRAAVKAWAARPRVAAFVKTLIVGTFFAWLAVFAFLATSEQGDRFSCAVKSLWSGFDRSGCPEQPWERPRPDPAAEEPSAPPGPRPDRVPMPAVQ